MHKSSVLKLKKISEMLLVMMLRCYYVSQICISGNYVGGLRLVKWWGAQSAPAMMTLSCRSMVAEWT
jgi:hypothetical protein